MYNWAAFAIIRPMKGFIDFIRKQGVSGLAVGFIIGGAISKLVSALVDDIINPLIDIMMGRANGLDQASTTINGVTIKWGDMISVIIDFIVIAAVVYFGVKLFKLDKIDKEKE